MITLPLHISYALQPFDVTCLKPFKTTFKRKRNNAMVSNNYNEPNIDPNEVGRLNNGPNIDKEKITLNLKLQGFGHLTLRPWKKKQSLTTNDNKGKEDDGILDEENETMEWVEQFVVTKLINITTIVPPITLELKTNESFENHPKYYVDMLMNIFVIKN
jgi:hypothetical protein